MQPPDYSKTYLGERARPLLIDMLALRSLASTEVVWELTQHRFWITLDYFQLHVFQTTGYTAPTIRAYQLYEHDITDNTENHFPDNKARTIIDHIEERTYSSHVNPEASDPGLPPGSDFYTGRFWNLSFHERHEHSLHFFMKLFDRGGYAQNMLRAHDVSTILCRTVGLRFNKQFF